MLNVNYHKDYRHNYLILKDNGCLTKNVYQRKMVTENKIKGLLESQERYINGDLLLYYEITSKQSLYSIYDGKRIGMEQLCSFFMQLKRVNEHLQKYLLDSSCLILQPEYVFQDIVSGEYFFLYYPDPEENGFSGLLDFFVANVNNDDVEAVEIVYKIADLSGREQFVLDEILEWFQDDIIDSIEKNDTEYGHQKKSEEKCSVPEENFHNEKSEKVSLIEDCIEKEPDKKNVLIKIGSAWGTWILGSGILLYLKSAFEFSYQEQVYLLSGWIIMTVLALLFSVMSFYLGKVRKDEKNQDLPEEAYRYVDTLEYETSKPAAGSSDTVFIPWTENCENKLYSMDRKNKCHIDLGKLPLTVGKLAGAVDMVIREQSISRMHARFSRTENNVYVTDLNSTNGTFKNGMRLTPNTSEVIEPGDEIRLGKLKFIYR